MTTTQQDFEFFKQECETWLDLFSLGDIQVLYEITELPEFNYAEVQYDVEGSNAVIRLAKVLPNVGDLGQEFNLKDTALHEVLELLLMPLRVQAEKAELLVHGPSPGQIASETHKIIFRIMRNVFESPIQTALNIEEASEGREAEDDLHEEEETQGCA